jgi:hypothetical protein
MLHETGSQAESPRGSAPDGYQPPRVESVLTAEELEREVMTGGPAIPSGLT